MNYRVSREQLYKVMKPYFDSRFKGSVIDERDFEGGEWSGLWSPDGELLVGTVNSENYYFNGQYFFNEWDIFGIEPNIFTDMMARYLDEERGLKVGSLS